MENGERNGGVEVVVHGLVESSEEVGDGSGVGLRSSLRGEVGGERGAGLVNIADPLARSVEVALRVVHRLAVVCAQKEAADGLGMVLLEDVAEGPEVVERLGHLLAVDVEHRGVHPVVHIGLARGAFRLGDLILMVGELEV